MMKKILLFLMIVAMMCSVLVGCGEKTDSDTTQSTNGVTTEAETQPSTDLPELETTLPDVDTLTFPEYNSMSPEQQQAVVDSFATMGEFFEWYEDKVEKYEDYLEQQKNSTESTEGNETTEPSTPDVSVPDSDEVTYTDYQSMSADEQMAFINSFPNIDAFFDWHNAAKQTYVDSMGEIDGSTPIDLGEFIGSEKSEGGN